MKYEDIFAAISRRYDTFTRMEQNIADYVLEHGKDVLEMSISTLARECKVVESTIFRFCRTLGVSGYRDFRTALAVSPVSYTHLADIEEGYRIFENRLDGVLKVAVAP